MRIINDIDEFFEAEKQNRETADSHVEHWQEGLKAGDHFIRVHHDLIIYGKVEGIKYKEDREVYAQPHMKHYRPTRCYSAICPDGEYGDIHVSTVSTKISPTQFNLAAQMGWPSDNRVNLILNMS
jgi:hypothetical protein